MAFREVVEAIGVGLDAAGVLGVVIGLPLQVEIEGHWPWLRAEGPRHG